MIVYLSQEDLELKEELECFSREIGCDGYECKEIEFEAGIATEIKTGFAGETKEFHRDSVVIFKAIKREISRLWKL